MGIDVYQVGRGCALKKASGHVVANFIMKNIICRFGIPRTIPSDNGTLFITRDLMER